MEGIDDNSIILHVQFKVHVKLVREWYTASICILPLKYPATMIDSPNRIHASSDRTNGIVGFCFTSGAHDSPLVFGLVLGDQRHH